MQKENSRENYCNQKLFFEINEIDTSLDRMIKKKEDINHISERRGNITIAFIGTK